MSQHRSGTLRGGATAPSDVAPTLAAPPGGAPALAAPPRGLRGRWVGRLESGGRYPTWVLLAALSGMFATAFPITILTMSLKSIAAEFGVAETTAAWVISAPMLLSAVTLPLLGKLGDLYGHRRVFLAGLGAATLVAAVTALAWDVWSLIGVRTLAAVAGGATHPSSMALIFGVSAPEQRVRAMGWWSMTGAAAPALGLVLGGPLVDLLGWRVVFVLQAFFSLLALGLAWGVLRETVRQRVRFDVPGVATLTVCVGGVMLAVGLAGEHGLTSPWVLGAAGVGLATLPVFVAVERRAAAPLLSLDYFARRNFSAPIVSGAAMGAAYMGAFAVAPFALLGPFGFSMTLASGIMLLRTASLTAASPLGGSLGFRVGERWASVIGCAVMTVGIALLAVAVAATWLPLLAVGLVLQGVGHGLAVPSLTSAVSNAVKDEDLGIASATQSLAGRIGTPFGIILLTLVYGGTGEAADLSRAFWAGAVVSLVSLAAAFWMKTARHGPEPLGVEPPVLPGPPEPPPEACPRRA